MNILQSSAINLIDFNEVDELIKAKKPVMSHGYYTHLHTAKSPTNTMPVTKTRKDGVTQVYWMASNPKTRRLRFLSGGPGEAHDPEKHLQHLKDVHGLDPEDILHLGIGDKVEIVGGKDPSLVGKFGLVYGHRWSEKHPASTVSVKLFSGDKKDQYITKDINVNDLTLEKKATPESKALAEQSKVFVKEYGAKTEVKPITPKDKALAAKMDIVYGFYTRASDGQKFFIEDIGEEDVTARVINPSGTEGDQMVVSQSSFKNMLHTGQFVRDVPTTVADPEKQPYSNMVESGKLQDHGMVYYGSDGYPESTPEAKEIFGKALLENWDNVRGAVISTASKYKDVNSFDIEDILSNVFVTAVDRMKEYEPYLMNNPESGLKHFLISIANESSMSQAYGVYAEKQMAKELDGTEQEQGEGSSVMESPHAFVDIESIEALDSMLAKEFEVFSGLFKAEDTANIMADWLGIGRYQSKYTMEEAVQAMVELSHSSGAKPMTIESAKAFLHDQKIKAFKYLKNKAETDWDFFRVLEGSIRLRAAIKNKKAYEALIYKVDKVASKIAASSSLKDHMKIGQLLLMEGVLPDDVPKVIGIVKDILNYHYTPIQITKEDVVPKKYLDAISNVIDHFGGLKVPHYQGDIDDKVAGKFVSLEQISLKDLVHNAEVVKIKVEGDEKEALGEFNMWKKDEGLPLTIPGEKWKVKAVKTFKSLAMVGNCEIFELGV